MQLRPASDGEELPLHAAGQEWRLSWHGPDAAPEGRRHGSLGLAVADAGRVVLVSSDGARWDLPAGRPEGAEGWEQTLRREVREEACAEVTAARLLGFARGRCIRGHEQGLVLVRAYFWAEVVLGPWVSLHEIRHRTLVASSEVIARVTVEAGYLPLYWRALDEAGLPQRPPLAAAGQPA
jgi:ADP-ribose pyrophosphatase YjhB (NUDIX family)